MHRLHPAHAVCRLHRPPSVQPIRGDQGVASSRWQVAQCSLPLLGSPCCTTTVMSGPEPPVCWSVCFGGGQCFFSERVYEARPLSGLANARSPAGQDRIPLHDTNNPVPPLTCWGPAEYKTPPPWDDACIWCLIGGRVFALCPSLWQPSFSCRRKMRHPGRGEDLQLNL